MKGEPGQGPYALPAIYSTHSLSTFASGFLFLSNKLEITICNWAGGVWEGAALSFGKVRVASLERELGKGEQLGVEGGSKTRLRTMSRSQKPGCRVSL